MTTAPAQTERVGEYRLIALIGEGGMGVVHLAQAPDGRRVALKVLRPHVVSDGEARERLAQEVASLGRVSSPRIAEVFDADPYGPQPYVAMRYVPGLSLHEHVREEGPIAGPDLWHLARGLAEALLAVHAVGVLHRDVKPSNVLMEGRSPVLIDFGLARAAEDSRLTRTGWLLGTPGYLAPEILYGEEATRAADVHSWAATVVYAATGRPPYGKGPAMAVMDRVRRGDHDLSGVPEPLAGLLTQALATEPLERPGLHEIRLWLHEHAADAAPPPPPPPPPPAVVPATMPIAASQPSVIPQPPVVPAAFTVRDVGASPRTRTLPVAPRDPLPPAVRPVEPHDTRTLRRSQLLGLGAVLAAAVAFAPYAAALLALVGVLLLRTASVTRERHARRRTARGRARWTDVPRTTLSLPGYVVLALLGSLLLVGWSVAAAVAVGVVAAVSRAPLWGGMLLVGLGFTAALWWGPGSLRARETLSRTVDRAARSEYLGLCVVGGCVVGVVVLLAALAGGGPTWSPAAGSPWSHGLLASVARHLA